MTNLIFLVCMLCIMSSCRAFASNKNVADGVAVVGCGVLGTSLCKQLLESPHYSGNTVTGITKTTNRHEDIMEQVGAFPGRFEVKTADDVQGQRFRDVVFCAPPSGFDDYPGAVRETVTNLWDPALGGSFVFTSSGGIYAGSDGEVVDESSATADPSSSPRVARLVHAEQAVLERGGTCLRLAGLYLLQRGAHSFWLSGASKSVRGRPDGIINLLHYDDAAGACLAALTTGSPTVAGQTLLVSDGNPLTRQEILQAALQSKPYQDKEMPAFDEYSDADPKGKVYNGAKTNQRIKWKPRYESFAKFMEQHQS